MEEEEAEKQKGIMGREPACTRSRAEWRGEKTQSSLWHQLQSGKGLFEPGPGREEPNISHRRPQVASYRSYWDFGLSYANLQYPDLRTAESCLWSDLTSSPCLSLSAKPTATLIWFLFLCACWSTY